MTPGGIAGIVVAGVVLVVALSFTGALVRRLKAKWKPEQPEDDVGLAKAELSAREMPLWKRIFHSRDQLDGKAIIPPSELPTNGKRIHTVQPPVELIGTVPEPVELPTRQSQKPDRPFP